MTLIIFALFVLIALALSGIALAFKKMLLATLSAFAWFLCAILVYLQTTLLTTTMVPIVIFFVFCFIVMLAMTFRLASQPVEPEVSYNHTEHLRQNIQRYRDARKRM